MTCGVFWLLLISPPLNAKAHATRMPWLDNAVNITLDELTPSASGIPEHAAGSQPSLMELEVDSGGSAVPLSSSSTMPDLPADPDPAILEANNT